MRRSIVLCSLAVLLGALPTVARAAGPEPAQSLLRAGVKKAKVSDRRVLVLFHASWCGWCKRLEAVLDRPEFARMLADSYMVVRLDVQETGEKRASLENPGGAALLASLGGAQAGLPFYAILDAGGKKLADSNAMPGRKNIGYPGTSEEIGAFEKLLRDTAPKMKEADRARLIAYLRENAPH